MRKPQRPIESCMGCGTPSRTLYCDRCAPSLANRPQLTPKAEYSQVFKPRNEQKAIRTSRRTWRGDYE